MDEPPYILDISGLETGGVDDAEPEVAETSSATAKGRAWIGMQFECCGVYTRIYRNRQGTAYEGNCPRCARPIEIRIGAGGTSSRMFRAI